MSASGEIRPTLPVVMPRPTGWAEVTGPDRVSWLQGMVSNDVASIAPGQGCFAAHLNARGKVVGLLRVLADADRLWMATDQDVGSLVGALDRLLIMEEATIARADPELGTVTLTGADARSRLEGVIEDSLDWAVNLYDHRLVHGVRVIRGEIGFDLAAPPTSLEGVVSALETAGVRRGTEADWFRHSLEAGIPIYGTDVDETTTLPELGERAIDYGKGCYIGQEVVAKIKYIGHVNRHFVGFRLDGGPERVDGGRIMLSKDGREAGFLTRTAVSSRAGGRIALGYVRHGNQAPGTTFDIESGPGTATIVDLPFVV